MSHLGERLSALVDGELSGAELDRANAHLAGCGACRVEVRALRRLKYELRSLAEWAEVSDADQITGRLLAMSVTDADAPVPRQRQEGRDGGRGTRVPRRLRAAGRRTGAGPYPAAERHGRAGRRRRRRYVLWTTLSLVVGIISVSFGMGGGGSTEPKITPQLEVFDAQHAASTGDVPFQDPAELSARIPAVAARR